MTEKQLTPAESDFLRLEAAREEVFREEAQRKADEHRERRKRLLGRLGMIGIDNSNKRYKEEI